MIRSYTIIRQQQQLCRMKIGQVLKSISSCCWIHHASSLTRLTRTLHSASIHRSSTVHQTSNTTLIDETPSSTSTATPVSTSSSSSVQLYESFPEFGSLSSSLLDRLNELGINHPTPIQQRVIPFLTRWSHTPLLLQSPTGTGKSLAFLLPLLSKVSSAEQARRKRNQPRLSIHAIIICPTQELAFQTESQLLSLMASDSEAQADKDYIRLCLGGFDGIDVQRAELMKNPPSILVGTPKRLNSVLFPQFETHATSSRAAAQARRDHVQVADPELDDVMDEDNETNWSETDEPQQGRGESHIVPNYRETEAAKAVLDPEYMKRNNIAFAGSTAAESSLSKVKSISVKKEAEAPKRRLPSSQSNQSFLYSHPSRAVKLASRTPTRKILSDLLYLVVDEADDVLKPISSRAGEKAKLNRARHPKPSNLLVRALTLLNPTAQLIASSATINGPLRSLVFRLGFKNPRAVHIRIQPRVANAAMMQKQQQQQVVEEDISPAQIELEMASEGELAPSNETDSTTATESSSTSNEADVSASSTATTTTTTTLPSASFPNAITSLPGDTRPAIPHATAMQYYSECAPNLQHFFVLAPSFYAWRTGKYSQPQEFPHKLFYDPLAPADKRQAVHEHNMAITHTLRRNAFIVDKIASLKLLLHQFQPKCALLVVDDTIPSAGTKPNPIELQQVQNLCTMMDIRSALLFHHLSAPSPATRANFFREIEANKFDVLIVGLSSVRGLDLPLCDVVIHLTPCHHPTDYIHASGRTGRMGKIGSVITLLHPEELIAFDSLAKFMPETFRQSKQILLPKIHSPKIIAGILKVYEQTAADRVKRGEALNDYLKSKLKKKVRDDQSIAQRNQHKSRF